MKKTLVRLALIASAAAPFPGGAQQPQQLPTMALNAGIHLIQAEVANTFETRMIGLMHRKELGANRGMLFVFPDLARHCMWMKNTYVPLSVAFIDERGVILNIADMQPLDETSHCAAAPARFALEMNLGWFAAKGVKPGARISGIEKAPPPR
jgi:uncharacterized membrane protein (UPF0127 family)